MVKDFLGFLDQQFFLDIKIVLVGKSSVEIFHVGVTDILSSSLFFLLGVLVGYKTLQTFHLSVQVP